MKRQPLGRGLDALLGSNPMEATAGGQAVVQLPVGKIDPNPVQPRAEFDADALKGLAASIRTDGVLQPVLVTQDGDRFTLITGERRLKACKIAGIATVPAIVREIEPEKLLEVTLVENIQREDLNPIEIAIALSRMMSDLDLIHEQLASRTGMSRTSITNHLRLLKLSPTVKNFVRQGKLQMGHARALLSLGSVTQQEAIAERAANSGLSVREVEELVKRAQRRPRKRTEPRLDPNVAAAMEDLERVLQAPVRLHLRRGRGRIEIRFASQDELSAIYDRIVGTQS